MLVVLFSNDVNLCTKAMVSGVSAFTKEDLLLGLKNLASSKGSETSLNAKKGCDVSNLNKGVGKTEAPDVSPAIKGVKLVRDITKTNKTDVATTSTTEEADLADDILCETKKALTEGLSISLEKEMKSAYDEQWLDIVFIKPPWTFKDLLRCYEKHWIAVFGMFLNRDDKSYLNEIQAFFTNTKGYGMTRETVSRLVHSSHQLVTKLLQHDESNKTLQQSTSTLKSLLEKCNKSTLKGSESCKPSSTTSSKRGSSGSKETELPDKTPLSEVKQTCAIPQKTVAKEVTSQAGHVTISTPTQDSSKTVEQDKRDEIGDSGIYDDGDVEMVSEEVHMPSSERDASTTSVLQVFQSVGETVFDKSASLLSALYQSNQSTSSQYTPMNDRHTIERSLVFLCSLLLTVVTAMARLLQCSTADNDESCYQGMCDALDVFTRECEINPVGTGLHPSTFRHFMSIQSNKETLANGLKQFADKLQELQEHIKNTDSDLYTNCQRTLMVLSSQALC